MSTNQILLLGALAGFTIFLGLPIGRLRNPAVGLKAFLSAAATGILLFLFWDVLTAAAEPVESALTAAVAGEGTWSQDMPPSCGPRRRDAPRRQAPDQRTPGRGSPIAPTSGEGRRRPPRRSARAGEARG